MGALANILTQMTSTAKRTLPAVELKLKKYQTLDDDKQEVLLSAARELIPSIREALDASWTASGIPSRTGALYSAAVTNARIIVTLSGLKISYGDAKEHVYVYGASQDHGWVSGSGAKGFKKKLKKHFEPGKVGTNTVHAARHFFKVDVARIQGEYTAIWQRKVNQILGGK